MATLSSVSAADAMKDIAPTAQTSAARLAGEKKPSAQAMFYLGTARFASGRRRAGGPYSARRWHGRGAGRGR
eukprot:scaffold1453_cov112-Isochrysis_galbana.AAC.2